MNIKSFLFYYVLFIIASCSISEHREVKFSKENYFVSEDLNYLRFVGDTIQFGRPWGLIKYKRNFIKRKDTIAFNVADELCVSSPCLFKIKIEKNENNSISVLALEPNSKDYFYNNNWKSDIYFPIQEFLIPNPWDSLVCSFSNLGIKGEYTYKTLTIYSDARVMLKTFGIGNELIRNDIGVIKKSTWEKLSKDINRIHPNYFTLFNGEVADASKITLRLFHQESEETYVGYNIPAIFENLFMFLYKDYQDILWEEIN